MLLKKKEEKSLLGDKRVVPLNVRDDPLAGADAGDQLSEVLKLSFAPEPVQVWARRDASEMNRKNVILGSEFTGRVDV